MTEGMPFAVGGPPSSEASALAGGNGERACLTVEIEPLDVLFCGGGRPFGPASRVAGGVPNPQVVAGAVRTFLLTRCGVDFDALGRALRAGASFQEATAEQGEQAAKVGRLRVRGPWFVLDGERLVPTPSTIERIETGDENKDADEIGRLDPLSPDLDLPGWSPPAPGMRPLWRKSAGVAKSCGGYLRPGGLAQFLRGSAPSAEDVIDEGRIFRREPRHGIGMDHRRNTAQEGLIYQVEMLRLERGVTLEVDLDGAGDDGDDLAGDMADMWPDGEAILALGGEGRRAVARRCRDDRTWPPPTDMAASTDPKRRHAPGDRREVAADGQLLLLTTPALLDDWRPEGLGLAAASVPGAQPVSGWDLARGGPKRTRFTVPAGSVYFLAPETAPPPHHASLCHGEDAATGWGAFLLGEWNHA